MKAYLLQCAYATNSSASYKSAVNTYTAFLDRQSFWEEGSDESIAAWLLDGIHNVGWKKNTVRTRMTGIKHHVKVVLGKHMDESPGSILHLMTRTIARLGDDAQPKKPIKAHRLHEILALLNGKWDSKLSKSLLAVCPDLVSKSYRGEVTAWFCVSFACFLRAEECKSLRWDTVQIEEDPRGQVGPVKVMIKLETSRFFVYKTMTTSVDIVM